MIALKLFQFAYTSLKLFNSFSLQDLRVIHQFYSKYFKIFDAVLNAIFWFSVSVFFIVYI